MMTNGELQRITEEYGTPIYVFYAEAFVKNYLALENSFKKIYSKYIPAYSYKTNYTPAICKHVKLLGGYAEVVSDMEYQAARALGYSNEEIIYNGPFKGKKMEEHLFNGGILNIDNLCELERVCIFCEKYPDKQFSIGIRVNINIGQNFISRFGIDADSDDLGIAIRRIEMMKNLKLEGIHCHIGRSRTLGAWEKRAKIMLQIAERYFTQEPPKYIDLGSGMFADMNPDLACQFGNDIPDYDSYAEVTASIFAEHYAKYPYVKKPILFTEPGTTVSSSYIDFIGQVESVKCIKGKTFVTMNCSKDNLGDICKMKKIPIHIIGDKGKAVKNADIVGYTCLEHDVMYENFTGYIKEGNYIIFENIGGYSNVSKPPFILPNCPMIEIENSGKIRLIKRKETFEDVFSTYIYE